MSTFDVKISTIDKVYEHNNANALELARVSGLGYQFVVQKGRFKSGDIVIYFPVDSLLPGPMIDKLGLTGKLSGPDKNRVKTIKLRGQISQGLVAPVEDAVELYPNIREYHVGDSVMEIIGVEKYEPPVVSSNSGNLVPLPYNVSRYDLENAQNYPDVVSEILGRPVIVTEKVEGSHWGVSAEFYTDGTMGSVEVFQRNYKIEPLSRGDEHNWFTAARRMTVDESIDNAETVLNLLYEKLADSTQAGYINRVTVRGEIVGPGIQGNYYNLPDYYVYVFEIEVNGKPVDAYTFTELASELNLRTVPILFKGLLSEFLANDSLEEASDGKSVINSDKLREGVVIKPYTEMQHKDIGRLVIKQRSPVYLAKTDF